MKKMLFVLMVFIGLGVAADLVIVRFWPDTKAGEYALTVRDTAVEWYDITRDFWVEQWHRFRPEEPDQQVTEKPRDEKPENETAKGPKAEEPAKNAEPPKPVVDLSKPWKGLESANWYCGSASSTPAARSAATSAARSGSSPPSCAGFTE